MRTRLSCTVFAAFIAGASIAQSLPESANTPITILNDLAKQGIVDRVRSWPVNWNGDTAVDFLVQTAFLVNQGGNAYTLEHRIYLAGGAGFIAADRIEISGGILSVTQTLTGLALETTYYKDDDGSCCPSGINTVSIRP